MCFCTIQSNGTGMADELIGSAIVYALNPPVGAQQQYRQSAKGGATAWRDTNAQSTTAVTRSQFLRRLLRAEINNK